jgi:hypothetical protein
MSYYVLQRNWSSCTVLQYDILPFTSRSYACPVLISHTHTQVPVVFFFGGGGKGMGKHRLREKGLSVLLDHFYPSSLLGLNPVLLINDKAYKFVLTELKHDLII